MDLAFSIFVVVGAIFLPTPLESATLNRPPLPFNGYSKVKGPEVRSGECYGLIENGFYGGTIVRQDTTNNAGECGKRCCDNEQCKLWVWRFSDQMCHEKSYDNPTFYSYSGAYTALKKAAAPTTTQAPEPTTTPAPAPATTTPEVNVFKFNETCCEANGVPEECMGLCRERIERRSVDVYPIDRCVEHQNQIQSCIYEYVPAVNCEWNDWQVGECSKTCAGGSRTNTRTKKIEEANGTDEDGVCEGEATMDEECNTQNCPPIHCEWNDWVLGECSDSCGTGTRTNTRTKSVVEANGGTCTGQDSEVEECNTNPCPIDCVWDDWQVGACNKTCGGGFLTKTRVPKIDEEHGGEECTGHSTITESCNVFECPVDCEWGDWVIGECSKTCGGGVQIDSREKLQEELYGGNPCEGDATRQGDCNIEECPIVYEFDETCCTNNGVPEDCMGLCREKTDRDVQVIMPTDRCEEHRDTIRSCMKIEGAGEETTTEVAAPRELLVNGGFEEADESGVPLGWITGGGGTVWRCAATGDPMDGDSVPRSGDYMACFDRSHRSSRDYYVYQDVDVASYSSSIDAGTAYITAVGYFESDQHPSFDDVYLQVRFLDSQKNELPGTRYDSGTQRPGSWTQYGVEQSLVPANTRYVQMRFNTWEHGWDAGSADDFSVTINGNGKGEETATEAEAQETVCEKKYNGYYSYGDCGEVNDVNSFEECCKLTKERQQLQPDRGINRFSYNGNKCYFKCGGNQDNRGGSFWSSTEDISTCTCG